MRIWDPSTGRTLQFLRGHEGPVTTLAWTADSSQVASGGADKTLRVWNVKTGQVAVRLALDGPSAVLAWAPDGKTFACGVDQKPIVLHDAETRKPLRTLTTRDPVSDVAYSPDGTMLAAADVAGHAWLWNVATGQSLLGDIALTVAPPGASVKHPSLVAVSPDGKQLAAAGSDHLTHVWEIRSGLPAFELEGPATARRSRASPTSTTVPSTCGTPPAGRSARRSTSALAGGSRTRSGRGMARCWWCRRNKPRWCGGTWSATRVRS